MGLFKPLRSRILLGVVIGALLTVGGYSFSSYTSQDAFCDTCHVHPHVTLSWKRSTHHDNPSGVTVHCVACHLPPGGLDYGLTKLKMGFKDLYGTLFKDEDDFDWEKKSLLESAARHTFKASCIHCHENLYPKGLTPKGKEAHLHYDRHVDELRCINCHLHVGHYHKEKAAPFEAPVAGEADLFTEPCRVNRFENFEERIPGTCVAFEMVAIPGGEFLMGSPENEAYRNPDEGPRVKVALAPFWMGKVEVTWNEYEAFYHQTATEGRTDTRPASTQVAAEGVDAITGATPPYGAPDQGWGKGERPAITMTHHAAMTYCKWLSQVTGKKYRLPSEAEWEYACRAGTETPYFFEGEPGDYSETGFWNSLFGADTETISRYTVYAGNSGGKTLPYSGREPNPFGLINMCGNVREFCLDEYSDSSYAGHGNQGALKTPSNTATGKEHVVRGGSFKSDAVALRSAARDRTRTDAWLMTDPQIPKSIWWYSDCIDVGFRVVCEYEGE